MLHHSTCSATLWLKYGLFKNDDTLIYVNGMGAILTLIYLVIYYANTSSKVTFLSPSCLIFM